MSGETLRQALDYAAHGWPVFPCQPGGKAPVTRHGFHDATTDPGQINRWFDGHLDWNLAVATGAPGPDVLDVDQHGQAGNGFAAFTRLHRAGLLAGASAYVGTPSGGLHAYFTGSQQRSGHLARHHLDFRAAGGYVLVPPSQVSGKPYRLVQTAAGRGGLDWAAVTGMLEPRPQQPGPERGLPVGSGDAGRLADWVARQEEGNRNAGLFWAANRVLEADWAADLSPLAAAARQAGLDEREILRTLDSARRSGQARPAGPGHQAEAVT